MSAAWKELEGRLREVERKRGWTCEVRNQEDTAQLSMRRKSGYRVLKEGSSVKASGSLLGLCVRAAANVARDKQEGGHLEAWRASKGVKRWPAHDTVGPTRGSIEVSRLVSAPARIPRGANGRLKYLGPEKSEGGRRNLVWRYGGGPVCVAHVDVEAWKSSDKERGSMKPYDEKRADEAWSHKEHGRSFLCRCRYGAGWHWRSVRGGSQLGFGTRLSYTATQVRARPECRYPGTR